MKLTLLFVASIFAMVYSSPTLAQNSQIDEVDDLIDRNSTNRRYITSKIFDSLIIRQQQVVGGSAVREGRTLGSNATVSDKGFTINIGSAPLFGHSLWLQGTIKGASENGFVNVFSKDQYQNTLTTGANLIWFFKKGAYNYYPSSRDRLLRQLRTIRQADLSKYISTNVIDDINQVMARDAPLLLRYQVYYAANQVFLLRIRSGISPVERTLLTPADYVILKTHQTNEDAIRKYLPSDWSYLSEVQADAWIMSLASLPTRNHIIQNVTNSLDRKLEAKMLSTYDSMQYNATWSRKPVYWISINYQYNTSKRPFIDTSNAKDAFLGQYLDGYTDLTLAINTLLTNDKAKVYLVAGIGYNNMREFEKLTLKTYEKDSWKVIGTDSFRTVIQNKVYDSLAARRDALVAQVQFSIFWPKQNIGIDMTAKGRYADGINPTYSGTVGIFIPISAGNTTLLLMPQVQLQKLEQQGLNFVRDQMVFGFNLSASIPSYLFK